MTTSTRIHVTAAACAAFITAAATGQGGPLFYRGMPQTPLGGATLNLDPNGRLVVSNIGSSGKDGVRAELGGAGGWLAEVDIGQAGNLPTGMLFRLDAVALPVPEGGQPVKPVCLTLTGTAGGQAAVAVDTSFWNPPGLRVTALLGGVEVAAFDHTPPFPSPLFIGAIGSASPTRDRLIVSNIGSSGKDGFSGDGSMRHIRMGFGQTPVSFMPGPVQVETDEIRISLTGLPAASAMPPIQALELRAAAIPRLIVSDEALGAFGSAHRGLGVATMTATTACLDCLVIGNIGSSGDDGVCGEPADDPIGVYGFSVEISPGPAPDSSLHATARTRINELESRLQSIGFLTSSAGGTDIVTDFSDIGASLFSVEVFVSGVVIGSAGGLSGPAATDTDNPECIIWDIKDSCAHGEAHWDPPVSMNVNGLGVLTADRLRITPELPAGPGGPIAFEAIEQVALTGTNIATLAINGETIELLPPCPWDCGDADGEVGINDFLELLSQWSTPGSCDFDGGGVRVTDFLELLANWGPCS